MRQESRAPSAQVHRARWHTSGVGWLRRLCASRFLWLEMTVRFSKPCLALAAGAFAVTVVVGSSAGADVLRPLRFGPPAAPFARPDAFVEYSFPGGTNGSAHPYAALTYLAGAYYGVTTAGGAYNGGTLFKFAAGKITVLHSFGGGKDGKSPYAGLTNASGVLYGTTEFGGTHGLGIIFSFSGTKETVVHNFAGGSK